MFCNKCGNVIKDGDNVCSNCGNRIAPAPAGGKLKSTFKGGATTPTATVSYNPTPLETPVSKPAEKPLSTPTSSPVYSGYTAAAPSESTYTGGTAPSASYSATGSTTSEYAPTSVASSAPKYPRKLKDKGHASKILMAVLLMAFVYLLPIINTSGGFFPEDYMKSWDFMDGLFSNFGEVIEGAFESAGATGTILMYLCPIAVLISALLNSKLATCIFSFIGAIGMLMILFSIFANFMDMGAELGDIAEVIFDFEHTPIACGFWISLIAYLASAANATKN